MKNQKEESSPRSRSNASKNTGGTIANDSQANPGRNRRLVESGEDKSRSQPDDRTPVEQYDEPADKTLKLGKKTKIVIFTLLLIGFLIILVPIIIGYTTGPSATSSNDGQNSIFNNQIVFDRLGLVAMDTPQICEIQQLIVSSAELNGRTFYEYLSSAGFTDCFFSSIDVVSPLTLTEEEFNDLCYLIANRMSKSSGSELEFSFNYVNPSATQLKILFTAMQNKQWKSIAFLFGSLENIDTDGTEILANIVGQQKELHKLNFKSSSCPNTSMTQILENLLRSESIMTLRELSLFGQKLTDNGIFTVMTITRHATQLKTDQPDMTLTGTTIEKREDQKFIYAFKDFGGTFFHSIPYIIQ